MYRLFQFLLLGLLLVSSTTAGASAQAASQPDSVRILSLEQLLAAVRESNPTLRAAQIEARALATRPEQRSALPDPTVMAGYRPLAVDGFDGALPASFQAQQMIPFPGKLDLAERAARFGAEMAEYETLAMALDLEYELKEAYYELFRIQEQERLIASFQDLLGDYEEAAAVKYEVGQGMQQAILKAQLERNALARRRLDLTAARRTQFERVARLTNDPGLVRDGSNLALLRPELGFDVTLSPGQALEERPEASALQAGMKEADAEVSLARREYLPDFMVGVGLMDMMGMGAPVAPLDNLGDRLGIEFGVVVPLQRGRRDAALQEAQLRREALDARYEALRTEIETEYNALRVRLEEDGRALALYDETLIPQAEVTLEATLSAYTTGQTDFLDLLDAQRMLFDLRMDFEETYAGYATTRAALERVLGISTPAAPAHASAR